MFKAIYKNKNYYFDFQKIFGNKIGIPCIEVGNELVSIHLMEIYNYCGLNDINDKMMYEGEEVKCTCSNGDIYYGTIVFDYGCYSLKIKNIMQSKINKNNNKPTNYDVGQSPPFYDFDNFVKI